MSAFNHGEKCFNDDRLFSQMNCENKLLQSSPYCPKKKCENEVVMKIIWFTVVRPH